MNQLYKHYSNVNVSDFRAVALSKLLKRYLTKHLTTLDAGCGSCINLISLFKAGYKIVGIEPDALLVSLAHKNLQEHNISKDIIINTDIESHSGRYDQIVCLDVLEHIRHDTTALINLRNLLNKNGILLIAVPAIPSLYSNRDKMVGHYRRYKKQEIISKLKVAGFKIKEIRYWNLLGYFVVKLLDKPISENFREKQTPLNQILAKWFVIENIIKPPIGLTLFVCAEK